MIQGGSLHLSSRHGC